MRRLNSSILWLAGHAERDHRTAENLGPENIPEKAPLTSISLRQDGARTVAGCATDFKNIYYFVRLVKAKLVNRLL